MKLRTIFAALVIVPALGVGAGLVTTGATIAADDPIKTRIAAMKEVGKSMGPLAAIMKGEAAFDGATVKANADKIAMTLKAAANLFPEGSTSAESRAKPEIWQQWDKFAAALNTAVGAAEALSAVGAANNADGFNAAFGALGAGCGGCHKPFRKPKS